MGRISPCEVVFPAIQELVRQGKTRKKIAEILGGGLTESMVRAFLERRGISGLPLTTPHIQLDREKLKRLLDAGRTQAQIAEDLGVSEQTIWRRAVRWDLQTARTGPRCGPGHPEWQTGRRLEKHGYVMIWVPLHPRARKSGQVAEHCLMMEVILGRYLEAKEVVHHRDDHPSHNWPDNLRHHASNADHLRDELTGRVKTTPRASTPGAYGCSQKLDRCPSELETLAQAPLEIRERLAWYIESHRPTSAHEKNRRELLRSGAWRDPFRSASTA